MSTRTAPRTDSEERFADRRRAERRRTLRRVLIGVLALVVVATLVWLVWFSRVLAVERVDVRGVTTLSAGQVRHQAAVGLGEPLARVGTAGVEARVSAMERVERVEVTRHWPRTLRVTVVERTPVAWVRSGGAIRSLDRYGVDFRTLKKEPKDLVEVQVTAAGSRRRQQALESAAAVVTRIEKDDPGLLEQVQRVQADSRDSVVLNLTKRRTVTWGSAAKGAEKLRVLTPLLTIKARSYDVSAPEQPTTRK